jgi:hypothetical protein
MEAIFASCSHPMSNVSPFMETITQPDPLLGCSVEIRSIAGIAYRGIIRSISPDKELGEIFELRSAEHAEYQRFVHVVDRAVQIRKTD